MRVKAAYLILLCALSAGEALATGPIKNGNNFALSYAKSKENQRREMRKEAVGGNFSFRYLRIENIVKGQTNGAPCIVMSTVEPGSDMKVEFVVTKAVSYRKAEPLKKGEAVAVVGRIEELEKQPNTIKLDPVIVRYKDRMAPAQVRELRHEVDPNARIGTDTSSGSERVIRGEASGR